MGENEEETATSARAAKEAAGQKSHETGDGNDHECFQVSRLRSNEVSLERKRKLRSEINEGFGSLREVQLARRKRTRQSHHAHVHPTLLVQEADFAHPEHGDETDWRSRGKSMAGIFPLLHSLPAEQLSRLVGWATHYGALDGSQNRVPDSSVDHFSGADVHDHVGMFLRYMPKAPPRPSLLRFLVACARAKANPLPPSSSSSSLSSNDSGEPLPASDLQTYSRRSSLELRYDRTAFVALAIAVEEITTALLLPLATLHVERCRHLESRKYEPPAAGSDPFDAWTMPPADAIASLVEGKPKASQSEIALSSMFREQVPFLPSLVPREDTSTSEEVTNRTSFKRWCRRHDLDWKFVRANMDLFSMFLPTAPQS